MLKPRHTTRRPASSRLRDERGFTLVELMVGITGAIVVSFAAFAAISVANTLQSRTVYRLEATNRARLGMERITRDIRAQQCVGGTRPMLWAGDVGMRFYASITPFSTTKQQVEMRHIEWVPRVDGDYKDLGAETGDIIERVYRSTDGGTTFPAEGSPTSTSILAESVQRVGTQPIFRYYGYDPADTAVGRPSNTPFTFGAAADLAYNKNNRPSLNAVDRVKVIMIDVRFEVRPKGGNVAKSAVVPFFNRVSVRTADPTNPQASPLCF